MGHMVGETTTYNNIVQMAEKITGRKFLRKYVGRSELEELAKDPAIRFYNQVGDNHQCKTVVISWRKGG